MNYKIKEALKIVPHDYVAHSVKVDDTGIVLMKKTGTSMCYLSWYSSDKKVLYIDLISVLEENQNNGEGTRLLTIIENIAAVMKVKRLILKSDASKWMYKWYKRLGYSDYEHDNYRFLSKKIKNLRDK